MSSTPAQKEGGQWEKIPCSWPKCTKTFTRQPDLDRHRDTIHLKTKQFWCTAPGCNRSESYAGVKRPFPRKDKLNDHVRKVHEATARPNGASTFPTAGIPIVVDTNYPGSLDGYANDSRLIAASGFPGETNGVLGGPHPTSLTGVDMLTGVEGLSNIDERASVNGVTSAGGLIGVEELANGNRVTNINELTNGNGLTSLDELTGLDGFTATDGLTSVEGLTDVGGLGRFDEFTYLDGSTSVEGLTNVAVPGFYVYDAISTLIADDGLDWFAEDSTFTQ